MTFAASRYGAMPAAAVSEADGSVRLLSGVTSQQNVIAFPALSAGPCSDIEISWEARMLPGADGYALALLPVDRFGVEGPGPELPAWEEPNIPGAFAVGFDVYDPPTNKRFGSDGNLYNKPQREVSIHVNGRERFNRLSPVEFRGDVFHRVCVRLVHVDGGAEVSVLVDGVAVYDRVFVADLLPYRNRLCFGGRTGAVHTVLDVRAVEAVWRGDGRAIPAPVEVPAFAGTVIEWAGPYVQHVHFPEHQARRVVLRYVLRKPPGGWDPWDRKACIRVRLDETHWVELARLITPYAREWEWWVDVTPYAFLLRGDRDIAAVIETWGGKGKGKGFELDTTFEMSAEASGLRPVGIRLLWQGNVEIGNPDKPASVFFVPREVEVPPGIARALVRLTATGHGMSPNSKNAAEFMPLRRTVSINGRAYENTLWRDDGWLNPCRPQAGTWKFSRAGWSPGAVVVPWDIPVSAEALRSGRLRVEYRLDSYLNDHRGKTHPPHYWIEGQVIFFATTGDSVDR